MSLLEEAIYIVGSLQLIIPSQTYSVLIPTLTRQAGDNAVATGRSTFPGCTIFM